MQVSPVDSPSTDEWLDRSSSCPSVHGYAEAASLLNDSRVVTCWRVGSAIDQRSLLNLNGDEHRRLRSAIAWTFRPQSVDRIRPFAMATAEELLSELPSTGPFDFMRHFAKPYVERTTCQYVGFPLSDIELFNKSHAIALEAQADLANRASELDAAMATVFDYMAETFSSRRKNPTDDILSNLAQLAASGAIDEPFAVTLASTLLAAGLDPTILQLGLLVEEFSKLPDVWNSAASEDAKIPRLVEEMLRYRSANQGAFRRFSAAMTLGEVDFHKDSHVAIDIAAANHDPRRFARPDAFDVEANRNSHLAFGFGPHHCLGAPLVRAQLQEALRVLANQRACPTVVGVKNKTGQGLVGPLELTVELRRRENVAG